jgi:hypothetical protein
MTPGQERLPMSSTATTPRRQHRRDQPQIVQTAGHRVIAVDADEFEGFSRGGEEVGGPQFIGSTLDQRDAIRKRGVATDALPERGDLPRPVGHVHERIDPDDGFGRPREERQQRQVSADLADRARSTPSASRRSRCLRQRPQGPGEGIISSSVSRIELEQQASR